MKTNVIQLLHDQDGLDEWGLDVEENKRVLKKFFKGAKSMGAIVEDLAPGKNGKPQWKVNFLPLIEELDFAAFEPIELVLEEVVLQEKKPDELNQFQWLIRTI